ncbi:MAG TPA: hypothetical protein VG844_11035 [Terracidiphilus sp.]|nr:hypothetical protein [Terracidiphilus sp.]
MAVTKKSLTGKTTKKEASPKSAAKATAKTSTKMVTASRIQTAMRHI